MNPPSDNENEDREIVQQQKRRRRRLTGTSLWTLNSVARQVAEKQADADIDEMINNAAQVEPINNFAADGLIPIVTPNPETKVNQSTYMVNCFYIDLPV